MVFEEDEEELLSGCRVRRRRRRRKAFSFLGKEAVAVGWFGWY